MARQDDDSKRKRERRANEPVDPASADSQERATFSKLSFESDLSIRQDLRYECFATFLPPPYFGVPSQDLDSKALETRTVHEIPKSTEATKDRAYPEIQTSDIRGLVAGTEGWKEAVRF